MAFSKHAPETARLLRDSSWALAGNLLGKGLSLAAGIIIARLLGAAAYGEYGIIKSSIALISILSTFGLGYTATKYIAQHMAGSPEKLGVVSRTAMRISLAAGGALGALLFVFAKQAAYLLDAPHIYVCIRISAAAVVFNALNTAQTGVLAGFGAFRQLAANNALSGAAAFVLSVALTYYHGLEGAVAALLLSFATGCLLNRRSLRKLLKPYAATERRGESSLSRMIVRSSLPIAMQEGIYILMQWAGMFMLVKTATFSQLGLYSAAGQWYAVVFFIPSVLRNVTLSHLSGSLDDPGKHNNTLRTMFLANLLSTVIPFAAISGLSGIIVSWYGDGFEGLRPVLNVLLFGTVFSCLSSVYEQEFISHDRNWAVFALKAARETATLALAYLLIAGCRGSAALMLACSVAAMHALYFTVLYILHKTKYSSVE